jgi:lysozyme
MVAALLAGCASPLAGCGGGGTEPDPTSDVADAGGDCTQGLRGIDVSRFDGTVDWAAVAGSGVSFAFAKASEGLTVRDDAFAANWAGMKGSGLVRGAYHFFRPDDDGTAQADAFLDCVGSFEPGDLSPVLDWEVAGDGDAASAIASAQDFIAEIQARTGRATILYTYPSFWKSLGEPAQFASNPLWLASDEASCPAAPRPWSEWLFWQSSDEGQVAGVGGAVDLDRFMGSMDELLRAAGAS